MTPAPNINAPANVEFFYQGQGSGNIVSQLLRYGFDPSALRPWVGANGAHYISTMGSDGKRKAQLLANANATLRIDEWKLIDQAVSTIARAPMTFVNDLRAGGLTYNVPGGMGVTFLEGQTMGDITDAEIGMEPARRSQMDRPDFGLYGLPLPVIYKDFSFPARQIATSRLKGSGLDTTMPELATRKVMEMAEKLALGVAPTYSFGGGTVYGATNFPQRLTKLLTAPTATGWTPNTFITQLIAMRTLATDHFYFGPYRLYVSPAWDAYLDEDYSSVKGVNTLRQRARDINGISDIRTAQFLTGFQVLMIQMTSDVVREVIGMDVTTLQWETIGGLEQNFKVMAILVPQFRADQNGNAGLVHGSTSSGDLD